ncbi:MAG: flippase [Candidatus Viridilinea halotolerans]|uniref:Flippase n=1 Tax=Candidatus Viridilinea halotolerans TaxID=2491704 RepID=A0A426TRC7_9CHLR|nr:MAG: flippase [Candidatus Viridilinea halotolerans]
MLTWLTFGLIGVLLLAGVVALLWRRFYRDDPANAARRVFKNSAVTLGLRLVVRGLDMVVFFLLAGTLNVARFGDYTFAALLVSQYLAIFTEFGLGVLLTREVARDPTAAQRLFGVTLALRLLLILVGALPLALLVLGSFVLVGQPLSAEGSAAILILMLTLVPGAYAGAVTALYHAHERMEVPAMLELVSAALSFLARIAVILLAPTILGLAWSAVAVSTVTATIFFFLQRRDFFAPTLAWDGAAMRATVPLALPLMLNNLLSAVFFRFDVFIVRAFTGDAAEGLVGQYNLTYTILGIALIVPPAVTFAVFPLLARRADGDRAAFAAAQQRTLQLLLIVAFPLAMGISLLAYDLVRFFTRSQFADYPHAVWALAILAWFLPLSFANGLLQYALIALNQQRAITRAFLLGAGFNLLANFIAIPFASVLLGRADWGLYAAAGITILSELVLYLVFRPLLLREGLPPKLLALSWRPALAALVMGLLMWSLQTLIGGWPGSLVAALVSPLAYAVALWALGGIGTGERKLVLKILGRKNEGEGGALP